MPQYIIGNRFKNQAARYPALRRLLWMTEALLFRLFFGIAAALPVETASRLGQRIAMAIGPRLKKHKVFRRNIDLAFAQKTPQEKAAIVQSIWGNVGAIVAEFPHLRTICHDERHKRLRIEIAGQIEALNAGGKPVIIVMAHLSNWEVAGAALTELGLLCGNAYTPMGNPWLDRRIAQYREALGVELFPRAYSMRPLLRRLTQGQSLAFIMDQRVDNGLSVPFMGMDKKTAVVPAKLGLRFDCEIVPLRVRRCGDARYIVTLYAPLRPDDETADLSVQIRQITCKINQLFEQWIAESPDEWFPSKRRWDKLSATTATASGNTGHSAAHAPE